MTLVLGPSMTLEHGMPLNVTICVGRRGRLLLSPAIDVSARETERGPTRHFMEALIKFRCSLEWCTCIEGSNQFSLAVRFGKLQGIAALEKGERAEGGSMLWKYASPNNRRKGKRRSWMELGLVGSSSSIHLANYRRPPARDSCMKGGGLINLCTPPLGSSY